MAIVPLDQVWVDANFKEAQLAAMRVGQPVTLTADLYGGKVDYHGKVAGFGAGTGAAFALLPAQNATGNWIKIVQRVPVRIALDRAGARRASAADRPVDAGRGRHARRGGERLPQLAQTTPAYATGVFGTPDGAADRARQGDHRRQRGRRAARDAARRRPRDGRAARIATRGACARDTRRYARRAANTIVTAHRSGHSVDGRLRSDTTPDRPAAAPAPLTGGALALGTVALSLATFMNVLDTSIANVSIPRSRATSACRRTRARGSSRRSPWPTRSRCR